MSEWETLRYLNYEWKEDTPFELAPYGAALRMNPTVWPR